MQAIMSAGIVLTTGDIPRAVVSRLSYLDRVRRLSHAAVVQAKCYRVGVRCVDELVVTAQRYGYVVSLN